MKKQLFFFSLLSALFIGCSPRLTPLTQDVMEEYKLGPEELKQIQFYTSQDIVLSRRAESGDLRIKSGKIKIVEGEKVEQVIIPAGTPGVFVFSPKSERIAVSFEKDDRHYLVFGPNPKRGDRYSLLGKKWKRSGGKVTYGDATWWTPVESSYATLLVDLRKARKIKLKQRRIQGRRVGEG